MATSQKNSVSKENKRNKILKLLGNLVVVLALLFIVKKLASANIDYRQIFLKNNIYIYTLLIAAYAVAVIFASIPWRNAVYLFTGQKIAFHEVAEVSTRANVMKYIPGNIFQYIGRNSLAVNKGLKHSDVAMSTVMDVIINLGSVFLLTLIFSFQTLSLWIQQYIQAWHIGVLVGGVLAVIFALICLRKKFLSKFQEVWGRIFCKSGIIILGTNVVIYVAQIIMTTLIYMAGLMIPERNSYAIDVWFMMAGAILVSWILGFITPGAPGGIGVREAVLIVLLEGILSEDAIILGVIVNRVVSILGDLLAMIIMVIFNSVKSRQKEFREG